MTQGRTRAREDKPGTCFALGGGPGPSLLSRTLARWGHQACVLIKDTSGPGPAWPWFRIATPSPILGRGNQNCSFLLGPGSNSP